MHPSRVVRCLLQHENRGPTQVHSIVLKLKIQNAVREGGRIFAKTNQPIPNLTSCDITLYGVSEVFSLYIMFQEKKIKGIKYEGYAFTDLRIRCVLRASWR